MHKQKKYITVLCDGMADRPNELGLTPMSEAKKPCTDKLCEYAKVGLVRTVPVGMKPGSDVANLAALGYEPEKCYTGRSPLEALSMGIELGDGDAALRVNLVSLVGNGELEQKSMLDYSAGEIPSDQAAELIAALKPLFAEYGIELYAGISYRHAAVIRSKGLSGTEFTPPHDITGKPVADFLPRGGRADMFTSIIRRSAEILADHPVNKKRKAAGKNTADAVWFWGEGSKPKLERFKEKFNKTAAVISAVDLVKGIGVAGGISVIDVPSATGTLDTDYEAKLAAAVKALETHDYCFIHFEGPDECGHQGDRAGKILAIERIDARLIAPLIKEIGKNYEYAIAIMPDHPTPLSTRTHAPEPVPFLVYDSENRKPSGLTSFTEASAASTGVFLEHGADVITLLFGQNK